MNCSELIRCFGQLLLLWISLICVAYVGLGIRQVVLQGFAGLVLVVCFVYFALLEFWVDFMVFGLLLQALTDLGGLLTLRVVALSCCGDSFCFLWFLMLCCLYSDCVVGRCFCAFVLMVIAMGLLGCFDLQCLCLLIVLITCLLVCCFVLGSLLFAAVVCCFALVVLLLI